MDSAAAVVVAVAAVAAKQGKIPIINPYTIFFLFLLLFVFV